MPNVSVIVPVYGVDKYIERCARSLFEQTLKDIEYLFVDDCSPDHSIEILLRVMEEYPHRASQIVIHRMESNSGLAAVRKWGMQNATGEYVTHCDSDDWTDTDMYRAMYEKAKEEEADVVVCDFFVSDGTNNTYTQAFKRTDKKGFFDDMLSMRVSWAQWNKLVKRSRLCTIYPSGAMGGEMTITILNLLNCKSLAFLRKPLYYYFQNPMSITHLNDRDSILNKYHQFLENSKIVISALERESDRECVKNWIVALKWDAKFLLWQSVRDKSLYVIWNNTYNEINRKVLRCPLIKTSDKIKYILTRFKLYPLV